ncbi:MAG: hypothetical protein ACK56F_24665, partial [bacterium]
MADGLGIDRGDVVGQRTDINIVGRADPGIVIEEFHPSNRVSGGKNAAHRTVAGAQGVGVAGSEGQSDLESRIRISDRRQTVALRIDHAIRAFPADKAEAQPSRAAGVAEFHAGARPVVEPVVVEPHIEDITRFHRSVERARHRSAAAIVGPEAESFGDTRTHIHVG